MEAVSEQLETTFGGRTSSIHLDPEISKALQAIEPSGSMEVDVWSIPARKDQSRTPDVLALSTPAATKGTGRNYGLEARSCISRRDGLDESRQGTL